MTDLESLLADIRTTGFRARRALVRDELVRRAPRFLAPERAAVAAALAAVGYDTELPPPAFEVGESWLLVHRAGRGGGVLRLAASRRASADRSRADAIDVERAYRGLLATVGRALRRVPHAAPPAVTYDLGESEATVEGSSLGLCAAIAALSALVGRPPTATCAGSAQVFEDGRLGCVQYLTSKAEALRAALPSVSTLVVAEKQTVELSVAAQFDVKRVARLDDAIAHFGLDVRALEPLGVDGHRARIEAARAIGEQNMSADAWLRRGEEFWESASAVEADEPMAATRGRLTAALFALHGGRPDVAMAWLGGEVVSGDDAPDLRVIAEIVGATSAIDLEQYDDARLAAWRAIKICEDLSPASRRPLFGLAQGTLGRAAMHAGDYGAAESPLRAALAHHQVQVPLEAPRSACYLATCLRMSGQPDEALAVIDAGLEEIASRDDRPQLFLTTELYARFERGRILVALGRAVEARDELERVREGQDTDVAYPRLGAIRELARAYRLLGDQEASDAALERCVEVASTASQWIVRRVAAVAVGVALLEEWPSAIDRGTLERAWVGAFGESTRVDIAARVAGFVY